MRSGGLSRLLYFCRWGSAFPFEGIWNVVPFAMLAAITIRLVFIQILLFRVTLCIMGI